MSLSLPIGILGQVWYLIVSIPDLCTLTYFGVFFSSNYLRVMCPFLGYIIECLFYPYELDNFHVLTKTESRAKIWYQLYVFKPPPPVVKADVHSKEVFLLLMMH